MEYHPGLPQHNDNVTPGHPLKDFVWILALVAGVSVILFWILGLLVDTFVDRMSPETEAQFNRLAAQVQPLDAGPPAAGLQQLADSMRSCAAVRAPVVLRMLDSSVPNAMVFPGGTIYVSKGLLKHVQSENGLAFVLAHELGHVANRDHLRRMGRGIVVFGLAALITGDSSGLTGLLAPLHELGEASYSREREQAADAAALNVLQCRYGHVGGATEFFESLRADDAVYPGSHYLASHPAMQARIDALQLAKRTRGLRSAAVKPLPAKLH